MSEIEIGVVGRVTVGEQRGEFVKVKELPDAPPSYLILTAIDRQFATGGGDFWVEDYPSLEQFFQESRWVVEWEREDG